MKKISKRMLFGGTGILVGSLLLASFCIESKDGHSLKSSFKFDLKALLARWFTGSVSHDLKALDAIKDKENIVPIAVLGSGPAGMGAALYGARANRRTLVFEGDKPGGQLMNTGMVENWGSQTKEGPELIMQEREHVEKFGAEFIADTVEKIDLSCWPFEIYTATGKKYYALTIVLCTGASSRRLGIPGEDEYWGRGVTPCAKCDKMFYRGMPVVVIGGGDTAVEEAMQLAPYASSVTVLVRGNSMRAAASMQDRLKNYANVTIEYNVHVQEVLGNGQLVTGIKVYNNVTKETQERPIDGVFLAIGHLPNTELVKGQVALTADGYIKVQDRGQETSVRGVFAAGDVEDEWYHQAIVAQGRGSAAGLDAERFLLEIGLSDELAASFAQAKAGHVEQAQEVQKISKVKEFEREVLHSDMPVIVDFYTRQCDSCKTVMPVFESMAERYAGKLKFVKIDADEVQALAKQYEIYSVPSFMVFKDGALFEFDDGIPAQIKGEVTRKELADFVDKVVEQAPLEGHVQSQWQEIGSTVHTELALDEVDIESDDENELESAQASE